MNFNLSVEHLVMLVAIFFIISFITQTKEKFDQLVEKKDTTKTKDCGQKSVNYSMLHYIFNSPASPRG